MSIYTKRGDSGTTSLMNGISVSKSDDRIELLGTIDELNSALGLSKVISEDSLKEHLSQIQRQLMQIMAGIADPRNLDYRCPKEEILALEEGIDHMEASFPRAKEFVLYGGCELSARLDMARARNTNIGIYEHYNEIQNMIKVCVPKLVANKDTLPKMMEKYEKFDETIANM